MNKVVLYAPNAHGLGARKALSGLVHLFNKSQECEIVSAHIPCGELPACCEKIPEKSRVYIRKGALYFLKRILAIFIDGVRFGKDEVIFNISDFPLFFSKRQILFFHNTLLLESPLSYLFKRNFKYALLSLLFRGGAFWVSQIVFQTENTKRRFVEVFPGIPEERLNVVFMRYSFDSAEDESGQSGVLDSAGARLFYPSSYYPHKNHKILSGLTDEELLSSGVSGIRLTIEESDLFEGSEMISCIGQIPPSEVIKNYAECDALLFLSQEESLGLPLVEAIENNLHIICPDLPYARELCGDGAYYFDLSEGDRSLLAAINRFAEDWRNNIVPDWSASPYSNISDESSVKEIVKVLNHA